MYFARTNIEVHTGEGVDPGEALLNASNDEERLSTHECR
ncbi:hypothetical protein DB31_5537 [Hyalangium minutum]|uniref:Uncharacterized protein n=1 Tax=Hyalangium minutum TaxID=394096 RepID=A0A085WS32_9BACT|nr:hypothetical protein DB31_5537 [Hyalangium minutum]